MDTTVLAPAGRRVSRTAACQHGVVTSRLAALSVDATDDRSVAGFWCAVLGWSVLEQDDDGTSIAPADGLHPPIDFLRVPDRKTTKNRLHIDLRADGSTTEEELDRLLSIGARRVDIGQGPDVAWVVLADPEGNEFCLLSRTAQEVEGSG
jgi:hypothetical protein